MVSAAAHNAATYLRAHSVVESSGAPITDELVAEALAWVPATTQTSPIIYADLDWHAHAGEHDRAAGSIIDEMFKLSGWSKFGVPKEPDAKIPEWCGIAAVSWLIRAGLDMDFNTSFLHTFNVECFFTYGTQKNFNPARFDSEVYLDGKWVKLVDWHMQQAQRRVWFDAKTIKATPLAQIQFAPGDIMLIDWSGRVTEADHITMVYSYDGKVLTTREGNRTGLGPNGEKWSEAVVECKYDLSIPKNLALIYGFGKLSKLDFQAGAYR